MAEERRQFAGEVRPALRQHYAALHRRVAAAVLDGCEIQVGALSHPRRTARCGPAEGFSLVNPLSVRKQIEGQIAWGLGDAMWQEVTVKDGRVVEGNFDEFQIARMVDYPPEVNIAFLKTDNKWISGVGEEAIPQIALAIAQAVFKITGKRIRSLPLGNHDLRWS
jgi:isoquinoline 1-oxidoreductase subunit beta